MSSYGPDSFDAVVAPFNVLDVLGHESRQQVLEDIRLVLSSYRYLVMSSQNLNALAVADDFRSPGARAVPRECCITFRGWCETGVGCGASNAAIATTRSSSDISHDYGALHYYTTRDAQERQLAEHGFVLLECLDRDGRPVPEGEDAAHSSELHYVARRTR